jgi:hypothetical protein
VARQVMREILGCAFSKQGGEVRVVSVRVVHPSAASLNSLAEILRRAKPLYDECFSIINNLGGSDGKGGIVRSDLELASTLKAKPVDLCLVLPKASVKHHVASGANEIAEVESVNGMDPASNDSSAGAQPEITISHTLTNRFNREELYVKAWSRPMQKLAQEYGVSGMGLANICRKLLIPVPGRGYWAKKRAGKPVPEQPSLSDV